MSEHDRDPSAPRVEADAESVAKESQRWLEGALRDHAQLKQEAVAALAPSAAPPTEAPSDSEASEQGTEETERFGIDRDTSCPEREQDAIEDEAFCLADGRAAGVFDGMGGGGHESGLVARLLSDAIGKALDELSTDATEPDFQRAIEQASRAAREAARAHMLWWKKYSDRLKSDIGTTASVIYLRQTETGTQEALIGHVGDSRVYRWRQGTLLTKLTEDDNYIRRHCFQAGYDHNELDQIVPKVATLLDTIESTDEIEKITDERFKEAVELSWGTRNRVRRAFCPLDEEQSIDKAIRCLPAQPVPPGDRLLLCSDGIHDNLTTEEIQAVLDDPSLTDQQAAETLVNRAVERGWEGTHFRKKRDDCTAVVLTIQPAPTAPEASPDSESKSSPAQRLLFAYVSDKETEFTTAATDIFGTDNPPTLGEFKQFFKAICHPLNWYLSPRAQPSIIAFDWEHKPAEALATLRSLRDEYADMEKDLQDMEREKWIDMVYDAHQGVSADIDEQQDVLAQSKGTVADRSKEKMKQLLDERDSLEEDWVRLGGEVLHHTLIHPTDGGANG